MSHVYNLCETAISVDINTSSMVATMANVLFFISVLLILNSSVVLPNNSFVFSACVSSSTDRTCRTTLTIMIAETIRLILFSGISSVITRCCCNVLPTSSRSPSGLIGPGPSLFSSASVLLWSRPYGTPF